MRRARVTASIEFAQQVWILEASLLAAKKDSISEAGWVILSLVVTKLRHETTTEKSNQTKNKHPPSIHWTKEKFNPTLAL